MRDSDRRAYDAFGRTRRMQRRIDSARREIESGLTRGRAMISTSWGKDSCALAHLVMSVDPSVPMVHLRSPYQLPGGERVEAYFRELGATLIDVPTRKTLQEYVDWLQEHGLGYEREKLTKAGRARKAGELSDWALAQLFTVQFLGMRADESSNRRWLFKSRGLTYQRSTGCWMSNPIGWWSTQDVWAYLVSRGVPWHPLYDCETHGVTRSQIRNAGWLTVQGDVTDWRLPWLREHYPEQYELLAQHFPRVRLIAG